MRYLGDLFDEKSVVTKEYSDKNYSKKEDLTIIELLAHEGDFKVEALLRALDNELDCLCIEIFDTIDDLDMEAGDAHVILSNYYDQKSHVINKISNDNLSIQSRVFSLDNVPYQVIIYADYDGEGSLELYFSKNSGEDWINIANDELTELDSSEQKDVKIRVDMIGTVRLKNIAWGCR